MIRCADLRAGVQLAGYPNDSKEMPPLRLVAVFGFLVSHDLRNVDSVVGVEMWGEYKAGAGGLGRAPTRTTAHAPETTGFHTARQQAAANIFYLGATYKFPQND